jgi:hypothetical protein
MLHIAEQFLVRYSIAKVTFILLYSIGCCIFKRNIVKIGAKPSMSVDKAKKNIMLVHCTLFLTSIYCTALKFLYVYRELPLYFNL